MEKRTRPGAKLCDNKSCPGIDKFGRALEIYPEMLKRNPNIVLCVKCYVEMLKEGKDVQTNSHGITKYHQPTTKTGKTKMAQVQKGKGARILVQHYNFATSEDATPKQARVITSELAKCPDSFYKPNSQDRNDGGPKQEKDQGDKEDMILQRLQKLEIPAVAVKTNVGKGHTGDATEAEETRNKMTRAQEDQQRVKVIEEWLRIKSQGPNSEGRDLKDEDDKELDFDKIMRAMDARKI